MRIRARALLQTGLLVFVSGVAGPAVAAEPAAPGLPATTYAQHLVDQMLAAHREVVVLAVHATPPHGTENIIVASNIGRIGKKADEDDLHVISSGQSKLEVNTAGNRYEVEETLKDVSGLTIGAIGVVFPYTKGQDTTRYQQVAADIQTFFAKHTLSEANLVDPYPYTADYSADNGAQRLVDATMARHPELLVLGMHVTLPGRGNVFLGSNIGRIGKKADEDDMRVVNTGKSNFEISDNHVRYEVELVLNDAAGKNIGALGTVFRYKAGDDKTPLNALAVKIRDEMAAQIPSATSLIAKATAPSPLRLAGVTKLPGYTGDFDHFAVDTKDGRLFLAGEDGAALEVFNLASGAFVRSIKGYGVPHSVLPMPHANEMLVIDGSKPSRILDAKTLAVKRTFALPAGADSVAYDASTKHLWVVTGGKDVPQKDTNLIEIDPSTGKVFHRVHFDADHVEALVVEQHGNELFINVTDKNAMAVIDKRTGRILHWWKIKEAQQNAPVAFDEATHRLFVVTRKPGMLVILNADTGATVASFKAPERTDEVVWDAANRRVYVAGGEGYIGVFGQTDADHYTELARVPSAPGAKTAVLAPSLNRLYVAASPGETKAGGAVLRYDIAPR
jgi:DNA-binding beta-propeller fold protein YncE